MVFLIFILPILWYDTLISEYFLPQMVVAFVTLLIGYIIGFNPTPVISRILLAASFGVPFLEPFLILQRNSIMRASAFGLGLYFVVCAVVALLYLIRVPDTLNRRKLQLIIAISIPIFLSTFWFDLAEILERSGVLPYNVALIILIAVLSPTAFFTTRFLSKHSLQYPDPIPLLIGLVIIPLFLWSYSFTLWFTLFVMGGTGFLARRAGVCESITTFVRSPLVMAFPLVMRNFELNDKIYSMQPVFASIGFASLISPPLGLMAIPFGVVLADQLSTIEGLDSEMTNSEIRTHWLVPIVVLIFCCIATLFAQTIWLIATGIVYVVLFIIGKLRRNEASIHRASLGCAGFLFGLCFLLFQHFAALPLLAWLVADQNLRGAIGRGFHWMKRVWMENKLSSIKRWDGNLLIYSMNSGRSEKSKRSTLDSKFENTFIKLGRKIILKGGIFEGLYISLSSARKQQLAEVGASTQIPISVEINRFAGGALYKFNSNTDFISRNPDAYRYSPVELVVCGLAWSNESAQQVWSEFVPVYEDLLTPPELGLVGHYVPFAPNEKPTIPKQIPWLAVAQRASMLGANKEETYWIADLYEGIAWALLDTTLRKS
ncbi:hypothetical protein L6R21_24110 [bacterium]|nr:hypothetical protein [bacterium]